MIERARPTMAKHATRFGWPDLLDTTEAEKEPGGAKTPQVDMVCIGENDHGYRFGVYQDGVRWFACAVGKDKDGENLMFVLPNAGGEDKDREIRLAGAIAQDPEHGYGGVDRWFVSEELRGDPEDFRCKECQSTGCDGHCFDYDPGEEA
jgi:hypothetical protein